MKQRAKQLASHPLIRGSTIVLAGGLLSNFFNFLYNLFMSRTLAVSDYGTLASIISFITFPTLFVNAFPPVIIRFAGDYFAKGELRLLKGLYIKIFKFLLYTGVTIFLLLLVSIKQTGQFLHVGSYLILFFADIAVFLSIINVINMSFIQAKLAFGFQVLVNLVNTGLKLFFGFILVLLGYSVNGAAGALVIAGLGGYCISFLPLRFLTSIKAQMPEIETKEFFSYGVPSALTLLGLVSFISTDIILVKHFFDSVQAGQYAGLSLVGRVVFFITAPIGTVMFPVIVQRHAKGHNYSNTFKMAVALVLFPALCLTIFYYLFPHFTILFFLKKQEYLAVSPLLAFFGFYITFYSVLYLFANFYISIKKTKIYIPVLTGAILQIILISLYHQNFFQIIMISFVLVLLLVAGFLVYYPYATKK
jgi:O-antigen/teichoic acid export membrane protein